VASDTYPDHLPLVFTASTLTVLWSIAYLRRGDLVTISRRAVLQGIDDAVIVLDSGDRIISANPACQALLGHPTTEVLGQRLQEVWPELAAQLSHTAERVRQEIVLDEGADERTYDVHISPLADWQGRPIGRVAVMRDMTERHRIEREKETLQSQLLQVRRMEAIGTLAGGIAHDFNNLLTAIQGNATLAKMLLGDESPASLELDEIELACKRASRLTQQLLMFSRQQKADPVLLYLNQVIDELVYMLRRLIGEDIVIETWLDPDLWPIYADKGNIEQVMINLTINARDAMPDGGKIVLQTDNVTIEEETAAGHADARPGSFVRFLVSDTGIGMGPQVVERLFEPFFSTKQAGAGTGLGLTISYGIVQQHRGWIEVESEVGCGSTFAVYIPMAPAIEEDDAAEHETPPHTLEGRGERILLVEDEKSVREFAARVLRKHGYTVFDAADAQEAMALLTQEEWRFDLLFSDVVLPDQSGLDLAEQVVAQDPTYRILLCSG
jgi:PAS domain S-box-containing protein